MCGDENYNNSGNDGPMRNPNDIFEAIFRNHGRGGFEEDFFGNYDKNKSKLISKAKEIFNEDEWVKFNNKNLL